MFFNREIGKAFNTKKKEESKEKRYKAQVEAMFAVLVDQIDITYNTWVAAQVKYPTNDCPEVTEAREIFKQTCRLDRELNKAFFKVITDEGLREGKK